MFKVPRQEYTAEFKEGAVERVLRGGESVPTVAKDLGLVEQTLRILRSHDGQCPQRYFSIRQLPH